MLERCMDVAYVFPGQGLQEAGAQGQEAVQLAVVTNSCMLLDHYKKSNMLSAAMEPGFFAGFSVGMWPAIYAAGMLRETDLSLAIKKRATLMETVGHGKMSAVIGHNWNENEAKKIWLQKGISLAVISCPGQFVISGREDDVIRASDLAKRFGMRAIDIRAAGANHSSLMETIQPAFREYVNGLNLNVPESFIMFNTSGLPNGSVLAIKEELVNHLPKTVQWEATVRNMISMGVVTFVEWGSDTLSKMIKRIDPEVKTISIMNKQQAEALIF